MGFPLKGYVYCYPGQANYLGGDILSGLAATEIYKQEEISVFLDIGTNGELVIGNKDFLVAGAGAAGPALEGGVVKTGMRAEPGAVDRVHIENGQVKIHVIGETRAKGICGSGIVDLLAEMFLNGWIDVRGRYVEEASEKIREVEGELAAEYAPGLFFFQKDIEEFLKLFLPEGYRRVPENKSSGRHYGRIYDGRSGPGNERYWPLLCGRSLRNPYF